MKVIIKFISTVLLVFRNAMFHWKMCLCQLISFSTTTSILKTMSKETYFLCFRQTILFTHSCYVALYCFKSITQRLVLFFVLIVLNLLKPAARPRINERKKMTALYNIKWCVSVTQFCLCIEISCSNTFAALYVLNGSFLDSSSTTKSRQRSVLFLSSEKYVPLFIPFKILEGGELKEKQNCHIFVVVKKKTLFPKLCYCKLRFFLNKFFKLIRRKKKKTRENKENFGCQQNVMLTSWCENDYGKQMDCKNERLKQLMEDLGASDTWRSSLSPSSPLTTKKKKNPKFVYLPNHFLPIFLSKNK
ncbi:hypothetical protein RFI_14360, partial [Reticulomyxa filosa]